MSDVIPITVRDLLASSTARLAEAAIPEPDTDAEWLLADLLGVGRAELKAAALETVTQEVSTKFDAYIDRRLKREPAQYITGSAEFYGIAITVDERVLIPRPETEKLVDVALETLEQIERPRPELLDMGTGSGCISIALARHMKQDGFIWAADISVDAIELAILNACSAQVRHRIGFLVGDLFKALEGIVGFHALDMIVSNPPYVSKEDLETLEPEILKYEPITALATGHDPYSFFKKIIAGGTDALRSNGCLIFEVGAGQAGEVRSIMEESGYIKLDVHTDIAGIPRVVRGFRP